MHERVHLNTNIPGRLCSPIHGTDAVATQGGTDGFT